MARPRNADRRERVPLGGPRRKRSINTDLIPKNKFAYGFCDRPGRLQQALNAGFIFVDDPNIKVGEGVEDAKDQLSSHIRTPVGVHEDGTTMYEYLMVQPMRFHQEDRQIYNQELDETDRAIQAGAIGPGQDEQRYVPKGAININRK